MNKTVILLHRTLMILCILILGGSLVYYLTKWGSLPDEPGIHFDSDGKFDVYASKIYGFYPHLIGGIALVIAAVAGHLIAKKNTGLNVSEKGENIIKAEILLTVDIITVFVDLMFLYWSLCVSRQHFMNTNISLAFLSAAFAVGLIGIITEIITAARHKPKSDTKKDTGAFHRSCRIAAWLLTGLSVILLAFVWERLPEDDVIDQYHGLAYFANFDAYLDKWLLTIPYAVCAGLLAVLEVISAKAMKKDHKALVRFIDRLKLINGLFFFWWNLQLMSEAKIGAVSVCIYIGLTILSAALYIFHKMENEHERE